MSQLSRLIPISGPGSGTVTSITFNGGLTSSPDPITAAGTATLDQTGLTVLDGTVYWDTGTQLLNTTATGTAGQILTSQGSGLPPLYADAPAGGITTIDGDVGSVSGSTVSFTGLTTAGPTVSFNGSGTAMTLNTTDSNLNTVIGSNSGAPSGGTNTGIGNYNFNGPTTGSDNMAGGSQALRFLTSGNFNVGIGVAALGGLGTGSDNIAIGFQCGNAYTTESDNILIGFQQGGTTGDANTLRVGNGTGTGTGNLSAAYIAGINGNTISSPMMVTIDPITDQLGTAAIPGGGGGALTLIQTQAIPSGSPVTEVDFTTGITYNNYLFITNNAVNPGNSGISFPNLVMQLSTDGGSTYITTGYYQAGSFSPFFGLQIGDVGNATSFINGSQTLFNLTDNAGFISLVGDTNSFDSSLVLTPNAALNYGVYGVTIIANALRVVMDDSSPFYGTFSLYGYTA